MKRLYRSVKVVYNAHHMSYDVYYRNWFFWNFDRCFKWDEDSRYPIHYCTKFEAETRAIERAKNLLKTVEIFRESTF